MIAGSNGSIAWGYTNVDADVMDLVRLDSTRPIGCLPNAGRLGQDRKTPRPFGSRAVTRSRLDLRRTIWGPVLPEPLLGETVALRWTALDPAAVNLGLFDMDRATTLEQAVSVMNRSGIPPQNVVLADDQGRIAWTYAGIFPKRSGFDGSAAESWGDGKQRWAGFIPAEALPRLIDPAEGYIATANNRTLGRDYPYVIGHNYSHSYRAYRISQRLAAMEAVTERDLLQLQLDTESEFFEFYRRLGLDLSNAEPPGAANAAARRQTKCRGLGRQAGRRQSRNRVIGALSAAAGEVDFYPGYYAAAWKRIPPSPTRGERWKRRFGRCCSSVQRWPARPELQGLARLSGGATGGYGAATEGGVPHRQSR